MEKDEQTPSVEEESDGVDESSGSCRQTGRNQHRQKSRLTDVIGDVYTKGNLQILHLSLGFLTELASLQRRRGRKNRFNELIILHVIITVSGSVKDNLCSACNTETS